MKIYTGINMANEVNNLSNIFATGVKFYSSLTRRQAARMDPLTDRNGNRILDENNQYVYVEPGAICFVSDELGNSIILNQQLFGGSESSGGGGSSGPVTVTLSDIPVTQLNNITLKTLQDYFDSDGQVISDSFVVYATAQDSFGQDYQYTAISISSNGIFINGKEVATKEYVDGQKAQAVRDANVYTDAQIAALTDDLAQAASSIVGAYTYRGSVETYTDLVAVQNPQNGYVYNVIQAKGQIGEADYTPPGTNYAYVKVTDPTDSKYPGFWDPLGGTINLSAYKTKQATESAIAAALAEAKEYTDTEVATVASDVTANATDITALQTRVSKIENCTPNSSTIVTKVNNNTTNITNITQQLTWQ